MPGSFLGHAEFSGVDAHVQFLRATARQKLYKTQEVTLVTDVPHRPDIPHEVGIQIRGEPITCELIAAKDYFRIVAVQHGIQRRTDTFPFRPLEGQQPDRGYPAGKGLAHPAGQPELAGAGQDEPAGSPVVVDLHFKVLEDCRNLLGLVYDGPITHARHKCAGIVLEIPSQDRVIEIDPESSF